MNNITKIKNALSDRGLDAIMLTNETNRRYAIGFSSTAGLALITKKDSYFFVDSRYIEAARNTVEDAIVEMTDVSSSYIDKVNTIIETNGIKELGFEDESESYSQYLRYAEKLKVELVPAQSILKSLRAVKDEWEIDSLKRAQKLAEKAYEGVLEIIRPGITECDIAAELTYRMLKLGAENISFEPIVVSGYKSSMPHGVPGNKKIEYGDFLTMDFGCKLGGYCSDMTRTIAIGKATDEMRRVYSVVLEAQLTGINAVKAGVAGCEVGKTARDIISAAGYGAYFGHGFGHSLGLDIHEEPNASASNENPLPSGAVISAEPGIYLPGRFGVRIEDVVIVREDGCENITVTPKELLII